jgi:hypothetical protein
MAASARWISLMHDSTTHTVEQQGRVPSVRCRVVFGRSSLLPRNPFFGCAQRARRSSLRGIAVVRPLHHRRGPPPPCRLWAVGCVCGRCSCRGVPAFFLMVFQVSFSLPVRAGFQFGQRSVCGCGCGRVWPRVGFCTSCGWVPSAVPPSVGSVLAGFRVVGFSGSRACPAACGVAQSVLASVPAVASVLVGCARGVDAVVRGHFLRAQVFSVRQYRGASFAVALVARSVALVRSVVVGGGVLVAVPSGACPAGCFPSRVWQGSGSGTWGSVALAVGLGGAALVWVGSAAAPHWLAARGQVVAGGWVFVPAAPVQGSLF